MTTPMDRRRFLGATGKALLVLPFGSFLLQACYGANSDGDTPASPPATSAQTVVYTSNIDDDHSHTFAIALAAFTAPTALSGDTSVDDAHSHPISIAVADLQDVAAGQTVVVTTGSAEGHTHVFTLVKVA